MTDASFASLSSTLLARKGGAKPAMRPQSTIAGPIDGAAAAANLEDLGWNDMGEEAISYPAPADGPRADPANDYRFAEVISIGGNGEDRGDQPARNDVRDSLDRIAQKLEGGSRAAAMSRPAATGPASSAAPRASAVMRQSRRAAFTLRLDAQRHLMLKLACTVRGTSAQQLVSDALDSVLAEMPEIAALAAQVSREPN